MPDLSQDPVQNSIQDGIKRGIRVTLDAKCFQATLILTYSGIDTMAYLNMPDTQDEVTRSDFVRWAEGYISFPCAEKVTGLELYAARCAIVHQYGVASRLSREGQCRQLGYMDVSVPEVRYRPDVDPNTVLVSVTALANLFLAGVDRFLIDLFSGPRAALAESRLRNLIGAFHNASYLSRL